MTVLKAWPSPIKVRLFGIEYVPDLDEQSRRIRLGVVGDLRMGERYALGLVARRRVDPVELANVGTLAQRMIEHPSKMLRVTYDRIWAADDAAGEFNRLVNAPHTSLHFCVV